MTDMQNIEATVCRDHSIARGPQLAGFCGQLLETEDFLFHAAPTTHRNAPGSNSKVAGSFPINSPSTLNHIPGLELIAKIGRASCRERVYIEVVRCVEQ